MIAWKPALRIVAAVIALTLANQYRAWSAEVDRRHALPIAWCPNFDSVRVHRADWTTRTNVYVRTIPATCGTPGAITYGYLGD